MENGSQDGWDGSLWTPHKSAEGGSDTIAYGHKIKAGEDFSKGITEKQAEQLLKKDLEEAESVASKVDGYQGLEEEYQLVLTEIAFNVGSVSEEEWPKLIGAMRSGDDSLVREEMSRKFTDKDGKGVGLTNRVKALADTLGL